jgi:hypothetical protein
MRQRERRQEVRYGVAAIWQDGCVRLRAGPALRLLNASSRGVLIQGRVRLDPGRRVEMRVVTRAGSRMVRSRVAWARVIRLWADRLEYQAGLEFENPVEGVWCEYRLPVQRAETG